MDPRLVIHSPRRPRRLQAVLTGAGERGVCWILTGGTFEQLEDSRQSTASRAATVGNILEWSAWRGSVAISSGRRWEREVARSAPIAE